MIDCWREEVFGTKYLVTVTRPVLVSKFFLSEFDLIHSIKEFG